MDSISRAFTSDPIFIGACLALIIELGILTWLLREYKNLSSETAGQPERFPETFTPPPMPSSVPQEEFVLDQNINPLQERKPAAPLSTAPAQGITKTIPESSQEDIMFSVLEEKFSEVSKRLDTLEKKLTTQPQAAPQNTELISSVEKKLSFLETEITKIRATQDQSSRLGSDPEAMKNLTERVTGLQRVIEDLTQEEE